MIPWEKIEEYYHVLVLWGYAIFVASVAIGAYLHPGYSIFDPDTSLSQLGHINDPYGFVFSLGVVISGAMFIIAFMSKAKMEAKSRIKRISAEVFLVALVAYLGIGLCPEGLAFHNAFAISFYLLSTVAILLWCKYQIHEARWKVALILPLVALSYALFAMYESFGFAFVEFVGGSVVLIWMLLF